MAQNPNKLDEALDEVKDGLEQIGSAAKKLGSVLIDALMDGVFNREAPEPEVKKTTKAEAKKTAKKTTKKP